MRRLLVALSSAVSVVALTHMASAADLGPRVVYKAAPLPPPVQDWSGVYVGVEGGYGWGHEDTNINLPWFLDEKSAKDIATCTPVPEFNSFPTSTCNPNSHFHEFGHNIDALEDHAGFPSVSPSSMDSSGWLGGVLMGVQKQWGSFVLGIRANADAANIKGSTSATAQTSHSWNDNSALNNTTSGFDPITATNTLNMNTDADILGSVRATVGYAFSPAWMFDVSGGLGFAHVKNSFSNTNDFTQCDERIATSGPLSGMCVDGDGDRLGKIFNASFTESGDGGTTMLGWTVGASINYKYEIDPGSALIFGVEYLHYGFPEHTVTMADNAGNSLSFTTKDSFDVVMGRVSWLFSIH